MPLNGYEATRDVESLNLNVIMHVLFPAAFIITQLLKFRFTESFSLLHFCISTLFSLLHHHLRHRRRHRHHHHHHHQQQQHIIQNKN